MRPRAPLFCLAAAVLLGGCFDSHDCDFGERRSCVGSTGCAGEQTCEVETSTYSSCECVSEDDAGSGARDAGRALDAGGLADAGGRDAGGPRDAGPPSCGTGCSASERCCADVCVRRSVPTSTDGRSDSSFGHCNGCGLACDPVRASACSVPGGAAGVPRCMCGSFDACRRGERCEESGGVFACRI